MKKLSYLCLGLLGMVLGLGGIEAKDAPTFTSTLTVTPGSNNTINVAATIKNTVGTCNDTGVKHGKVYIYLQDDELFEPTGITGVYRNYNEANQEFTESSSLCSYDGLEHAVVCNFGRVSATPALINYSDCKDEMRINFSADYCDGKTDCNIRVVVKGEAIDYNSGSPMSISSGITTLHEKSFTCNGSTQQTPIASNPIGETQLTDTPNQDVVTENPNTADNISLYFGVGLISFILMCVCLTPKKNKRLRTSR